MVRMDLGEQSRLVSRMARFNGEPGRGRAALILSYASRKRPGSWAFMVTSAAVVVAVASRPLHARDTFGSAAGFLSYASIAPVLVGGDVGVLMLALALLSGRATVGAGGGVGASADGVICGPGTCSGFCRRVWGAMVKVERGLLVSK